MSLKIKVYSDYVWPYCYLAEFPLQEAVRGKDVEVEWMPFELRPEPHPTLRPEGDYLQRAWQQSVYPLARQMGVPITLPRPAGRRVVLRLRQADVLAKTVTLPIAAENHIHQALSFQMDQETPFTPDEIYWSHFIARRDRQSGRLSVRLLLVPRQSLAALLGALERVGIVPNRAEIGDGPDRDRTLPLDASRPPAD